MPNITDWSGSGWDDTGTGSVNFGTAGEIAWYSTTTNTVSGNPNLTFSAGVLTIGEVTGPVSGQITLYGATSGTVTLGTAAIAGTGTVFNFPNNDGSNGYVLKTDGSGNTSWEALSGVSVTSFTGDGTLITNSGSTGAVTVTLGTVLPSGIVTSSLQSVGTISSGTWAGTTIAINHGGTGQTTAANAFIALSPLTTQGDIIYENSTPAPARLAIGSTSTILTVAAGIPAWTTNTYPSTDSKGDILYASLANTISGLAIGSQYNVLTCSATPLPSWGQVALNQSAAVTGTLPIGNGGTGAASLTGHGAVVMNAGGTAQTTVAPGSSGNLLTSNGTDWTSAAPATSGTVTSFSAGTLSPLFTTSVANATSTPALTFSLTNAAAGTIFGNWASSSGAPSYNGSGSTGNVPTVQSDGSIIWASPSGSGTVNSGTAGQMAYYATSTNAVSGNSNATISNGALILGKATGPVEGSLELYGSTSGTCTILTPAAAGTNSMATMVSGNSNTILPLGSATSHNWIQYIDSTGTQNLSQPAFTDITGSVTAAQMLALASGDVYIGNGSNQPAAATMTTLTSNLNLATDLLQGLVPATTNAQILVGKTSHVIQAVSMSGDVTIDNTGATTIKTNVSLAGSPTTTTQSASDNSTKIATTAYVTTGIANAISGVNPAIAVQAATTAAGDTSGFTYNNVASGVGATFTGTVNTAVTIDGYTFTATGQRLLVKNDTQSGNPGAYNGVYYLSQLQTGILAPVFTRALDYNTPASINNTGAIPVVNGTVNANTSWLLTSAVTTVGTDPLTYVQFSLAPTSIVTATGNLTQYGVVLGQGSKVVTSTSAGTNKYPLVANTSANPTFQQLDLTAGVTGTLPIGNGGTGAASLAGHGVVVMNSGGTAQTVVAPSTSGNILTSNGTDWASTAPAASGGSGFGGNGADGAVHITGATSYHGPKQINCTTFLLDSGVTLTMDTGGPIIINATSTITINGTITFTAGSGQAGGVAGGYNSNFYPGGRGAGLGAGDTQQGNVACAGGGGGNGGAGGGTSISSSSNFSGGGAANQDWLHGGSGGGGGGYSGQGTTSVAGTGGAGGASCILIAVGAISFGAMSAYTSNGAAGQAGQSGDAGGGGGGAGGNLYAISQTSVTQTSGCVITCVGGVGGASVGSSGNCNGGGGGGGGRFRAWSPSNTISGTVTLTHGAGGSGNNVSGQNGGDGVNEAITGTPNLPILG